MLEKHAGITDGLSSIEALSKHLEQEVRYAAGAYAYTEALKLLRDVPVEELNRDKRGLRVKLLRDSGAETIADVANMTAERLTAINGIGADMALAIRRLAEDLVNETKKNVRIVLSVDQRTPEAERLVTALSKYRRSKPHIRRCESLLTKYRRDVAQASEDLYACAGTLKWLFASPAAKRNAEAAYSFLGALAFGDYGRSAEENILALRGIHESTAGEAWADFEKNSIAFFTELESLAPGILGADSTRYGLPEALAESVNDVIFSLEGLRCTLRRYQEWGVKYILRQERVLLGDEMGLGKTVQAIAAMVALRNGGATHFVVICPASVLTNWCRELQRHSNLRVVRVYGQTRGEALAAWLGSGGVAVTTYETTAYFRLPDGFSPAMVVADEAHYIKNPEAMRSKNVRSICARAPRLLFLTGTALENRVDEMLELIRVLQPQVAADAEKLAFLSSAPQFREAVAPVYYRRKREEVLRELPELIETDEWCTLTPEETEAYEAAVLYGTQADARRVSWNVPDLGCSSKVRRLRELVEEAESEGRKVLVFSFFLETIRSVCELLGERCMDPIHGAVPPPRRQEILDEFERAGAGAVLAAQIQTGGTGLNIQSASVVILCEPQLKPSTEMQAISRAYRMGQARSVLAYRLLCDDTVDERLTELLEQKRVVFDAFADRSEAAREDLELDARTLDAVLREEAERIREKRGLLAPNTNEA